MNPWRGVGNLPREIWLLFCATLINRAGTMALPFLVLYLTQHLGFSTSHAGLVMAAYGAGALIAMPTAGRLSDAIGPLNIVKLTLLLSGTFLLAFPLVHNFGAILATTFAWAVLGEGYRPASLTLISNLVGPEQRKAAFAVIRLAVNLGMTVGPATGGLLAAHSYPTIFRVDGVTSILTAIFLILVPWHTVRSLVEERPIPSGPVAFLNESQGASLELLPPPSPFPSIIRRPDRRLTLFLFAQIPVMMVFFQFSSGMPLYMTRNLHLSPTTFGFLLPINTLLIIFLEVPINIAMERWPHHHSLPLGAFLCGMGFGALIFASGVGSVAVTIIIWTFGEMILFPGSSTYVAEIAPPERRGAYMGWFTMSVSLALVIGPWLGAVVLGTFGPATLWMGAFAFGCISAGLMLKLEPQSGIQGAAN